MHHANAYQNAVVWQFLSREKELCMHTCSTYKLRLGGVGLIMRHDSQAGLKLFDMVWKQKSQISLRNSAGFIEKARQSNVRSVNFQMFI